MREELENHIETLLELCKSTWCPLKDWPDRERKLARNQKIQQELFFMGHERMVRSHWRLASRASFFCEWMSWFGKLVIRKISVSRSGGEIVAMMNDNG